jgi:hypothetical protein
MSHSIGCVRDTLYRLSVQTDSSYETLLSEAMETKLYYLRDTSTPVEFAELVEIEVRRLRDRSPIEPEINFKDIMRSLKKKIKKIFH